jgi:hypothetical protein
MSIFCRVKFVLALVLTSNFLCLSAQAEGLVVPLGGNAYVTHMKNGGDELINDSGLHNWNSRQAIVSIYFRPNSAGSLQLSVKGSLDSGTSTIKVSINGESQLVNLKKAASFTIPVGNFVIPKAGYVRVDLQGVSKSGAFFADVSGLELTGPAVAGGAVFADDPANFYFSLRGPSVHLGYEVPKDTEYFYSELTVPKEQDTVGSYYMANGFSAGYFGIQVNSTTERRVLFSVWDPVSLAKKGNGVVVGKFGGEGTGGQSYLNYPWVAGETYRFITRAQPTRDGATLYSAWFSRVPHDPQLPAEIDGSDWKFIATWRYSNGAQYVVDAYSFLECFESTLGYQGRQALYGNQWARSKSGRWTEITSASFTVDDTGKKRQRLDYFGRVIGDQFQLRNGGFSNETPVAPTLVRQSSRRAPDVDVTTLP